MKYSLSVLAMTFLVTGSGCHRGSSSSAEGVGGGDGGSATPAASALGLTGLSALSGFEGEIDLVAQSSEPGRPSTPQTVNLFIKNDKIRTDLPPQMTTMFGGGKAYAVLDTPDKKAYLVIDAKKEAISLDLNQTEHFKALAGGPPSHGGPGAPSAAPSKPPPKVTKTGRKETVAGYSCEDWEVTSSTDNKKQLTACVAQIGGVSFFHLPLTGVPTEHAWALELLDGEHLPLRGIAYDEKTGAESGRVEVTKIDKHPLDAAMFEIPAGYKVIGLDQMIQAFSGGGMPGGMPAGMPGMPPGFPARPGHH